MRLSKINSKSIRRLQRGLALHLFRKAYRLRHVARRGGSIDYAEHLDGIYKLLSNKVKRSDIL